jgi:hypothetical protein
MPAGMTEWFDGYLMVGNHVLLVDVKHWNLSLSCLKRKGTLEKCQQNLLVIRSETPKMFANKQTQALYINAVYHDEARMVCTRFASQTNGFVEHSEPQSADVIEVPGIIDLAAGHNNVPPFHDLLATMESFKRG